eukprot:748060-Hanusia_phi.AAC.6
MSNSCAFKSRALPFLLVFLLHSVIDRGHAASSTRAMSFVSLPKLGGRGPGCCSSAARRFRGSVSMTASATFVVSAGKGSEENVVLGKLIVSGMRRRGLRCLSLETRLRQAVDSPQDCSFDAIYRNDQLSYLDNEFLAIHAASGMRVASGCPVRLLYGIHGGCDACKCRVPNFQEVKRFCPYYGSGARYERRCGLRKS